MATTVTEKDILDQIWKKYGDVPSSGEPPRYFVCEHPRTPLGDMSNNRVLDCLVMDRFKTRPKYEWSQATNSWVAIDNVPEHSQVLGFEVKVSRGDWLRELKDPTKAEAWRRYCTHFYVATIPNVVKVEELPVGWGLMVNGRIRKQAKYTPAEPMPENIVNALIWSAIKTGNNRHSLYQ